jgi:hypothetical protein
MGTRQVQPLADAGDLLAFGVETAGDQLMGAEILSQVDASHPGRALEAAGGRSIERQLNGGDRCADRDLDRKDAADEAEEEGDEGDHKAPLELNIAAAYEAAEVPAAELQVFRAE